MHDPAIQPYNTLSNPIEGRSPPLLDHPALADLLVDVRLLPRRAAEEHVYYGYVPSVQFASVIGTLADRLIAARYEVHRCAWSDEVVLLILSAAGPCAIALTCSPRTRYDLYALPRARTAQQVWHHAQMLAQRR